MRRFIGRRNGEAVLVGEVNLPPEQQREFLGDEDGDELQLVLSFTVNQAMFLALAREQAAPLARALEALPPIPNDCQWANFVRNHDELTLDKLSDEERQEVFAAFGPDEELQLYGRGLRRRLPTMLEGDQRRIRMVYSLAFSLPGTPVLFYGEEIGMAENVAIDGRYSVRSPMQWSDEPKGGFSTAEETVRPLVEEGPFGFREVNVARQRRDPHALLNWMERLIRRRRECPELGWGDWSLLPAGDSAVFAHRVDWDGSTVVAVHNLGARDARAQLELGEVGALVDLFEQEEHQADSGRLDLALRPYDARWFRFRRPGQRLPP
jgi:maltose alpha-D-glucosyltransferase/alpha-amylase